MGTDIHVYLEGKKCSCCPSRQWEFLGAEPYDSPLERRNYGMFGFLADVRNYSHVPVIAERRDIPEDASAPVLQEWEQQRDRGRHSASWLSLDELLKYDYTTKFEDRRVTRETSPGCWDGTFEAEPGEGEMTTVGEFLGPRFQRRIHELHQQFGVTFSELRLVFWFDC